MNEHLSKRMGAKPPMALGFAAAAMAALGFASVALADFQGSTHLMPFDEDTIQYSKTPAADAVARLQERIDRGLVQFKFDKERGYLPALLDELRIPSSSQMLVFSKTSFQRERIGPKTPRALYFNDEIYVGFIPGSPLMEVSAVDPKLGGVFYTLEQRETVKPRFVRNDQCLECHASAKSMGVPGHLVRSFATDEHGVVDLNSGTSQVNHRTPLAERWGGWYVTGEHGHQPHRGNLIGPAAFERQAREPNYLGNQTELKQFFEVSPYPVQTSDIVALMVLEHQTHMHNFITRLHYQATLALAQYGHVNYMKSAIEAFLKYLLFVEEAPLSASVNGCADYTEWFMAQGPKDRRGRSLRQFDLQTRLFKYPCSFLIYSEAFDKLPDPLQTVILQRLYDILTGNDPGPEFQKIPIEIRRSIREILAETKAGWPPYWTQANATPGQSAH